MKAIGAYLGVVWQILRKDIQVEWRGRQGLPVMLMFALMIVFLFNFALQLAPDVQAGLTSGLLWVSLAFASTLGLNRSISLERENNALDGLLLAPVDRSAIFFWQDPGKLLLHNPGGIAAVASVQPVLWAELAARPLVSGHAFRISRLHQPGNPAICAQHSGAHT